MVSPTATEHRPWPLPHGPWFMGMRWHDLAFLHWPVAPSALRPLVPPALELDLFDGQAWLGVVPFGMQRVRPRIVPPLPWFSAFLELNVRTYVSAGGKAGVWFFSLDAANPVAVRAARWSYQLPYFDARMSLSRTDRQIHYRSKRTHRGAPPAEFVGSFGPTGDAVSSRPGTIDHWLTERYCLYAADRRGRVARGDIQHQSWPLQPGVAEIEHNTMAAPLGLQLPSKPELVHFSALLDVVAWRPQRLEA